MRYFIAFIATIWLLCVLLFLLFHGGSKPASPKGHKTLASYATTDAVAQLTIDGPINADQLHQAIRITVDSTNTTFEQLRGYQGDVVNTQIYANNGEAYVNFLLALAHAGFTSGSNDPQLKDERGYCALGDRYILQFTQDGTDIERYWATSCGGTKTYMGNLDLTLRLFTAQVPDYQKLTRTTNF